MKIDSAATRDKVRAKYGSVAAFQRSCGVTHRYFHMIVSGIRGGRSHRPSQSGEVLARLKREDLLVEAADQ